MSRIYKLIFHKHKEPHLVAWFLFQHPNQKHILMLDLLHQRLRKISNWNPERSYNSKNAHKPRDFFSEIRADLSARRSLSACLKTVISILFHHLGASTEKPIKARMALADECCVCVWHAVLRNVGNIASLSSTISSENVPGFGIKLL